jgi:hypothetical protein
VIVTDLQKSQSVRLEAGGAVRVEDAAVPRCTSPGTTSSTIAADGRTIGFDDHGKVKVTAGDPATAFGCQ